MFSNDIKSRQKYDPEKNHPPDLNIPPPMTIHEECNNDADTSNNLTFIDDQEDFNNADIEAFLSQATDNTYLTHSHPSSFILAPNENLHPNADGLCPILPDVYQYYHDNLGEVYNPLNLVGVPTSINGYSTGHTIAKLTKPLSSPLQCHLCDKVCISVGNVMKHFFGERHLAKLASWSDDINYKLREFEHFVFLTLLITRYESNNAYHEHLKTYDYLIDPITIHIFNSEGHQFVKATLADVQKQADAHEQNKKRREKPESKENKFKKFKEFKESMTDLMDDDNDMGLFDDNLPEKTPKEQDSTMTQNNSFFINDNDSEDLFDTPMLTQPTPPETSTLGHDYAPYDNDSVHGVLVFNDNTHNSHKSPINPKQDIPDGVGDEFTDNFNDDPVKIINNSQSIPDIADHLDEAILSNSKHPRNNAGFSRYTPAENEDNNSKTEPPLRRSSRNANRSSIKEEPPPSPIKKPITPSKITQKTHIVSVDVPQWTESNPLEVIWHTVVNSEEIFPPTTISRLVCYVHEFGYYSDALDNFGFASPSPGNLPDESHCTQSTQWLYPPGCVIEIIAPLSVLRVMDHSMMQPTVLLSHVKHHANARTILLSKHHTRTVEMHLQFYPQHPSFGVYSFIASTRNFSLSRDSVSVLMAVVIESDQQTIKYHTDWTKSPVSIDLTPGRSAPPPGWLCLLLCKKLSKTEEQYCGYVPILNLNTNPIPATKSPQGRLLRQRFDIGDIDKLPTNTAEHLKKVTQHFLQHFRQRSLKLTQYLSDYNTQQLELEHADAVDDNRINDEIGNGDNGKNNKNDNQAKDQRKLTHQSTLIDHDGDDNKKTTKNKRKSTFSNEMNGPQQNDSLITSTFTQTKIDSKPENHKSIGQVALKKARKSVAATERRRSTRLLEDNFMIGEEIKQEEANAEKVQNDKKTTEQSKSKFEKQNVGQERVQVEKQNAEKDKTEKAKAEKLVVQKANVQMEMVDDQRVESGEPFPYLTKSSQGPTISPRSSLFQQQLNQPPRVLQIPLIISRAISTPQKLKTTPKKTTPPRLAITTLPHAQQKFQEELGQQSAIEGVNLTQRVQSAGVNQSLIFNYKNLEERYEALEQKHAALETEFSELQRQHLPHKRKTRTVQGKTDNNSYNNNNDDDINSMINDVSNVKNENTEVQLDSTLVDVEQTNYQNNHSVTNYEENISISYHNDMKAQFEKQIEWLQQQLIAKDDLIKMILQSKQ